MSQEGHFPSGNPVIEECREKAEAIEEWVGELEGLDIEEIDDDDLDLEDEPDEEDFAVGDEYAAAHEEWTEARDTARNDKRSEIASEVEAACESLQV
jgi:hypothetical protein